MERSVYTLAVKQRPGISWSARVIDPPGLAMAASCTSSAAGAVANLATRLAMGLPVDVTYVEGDAQAHVTVG